MKIYNLCYLKTTKQGCTMPVVMVFGLVGNLLSIIVLRSSAIDMKVYLNKNSNLFVFLRP